MAMLTLSHASSALSFVHHPSPQALGCSRAGGGGGYRIARPGTVGLNTVASAPPASTVNAPAINGVDRDRSGREASAEDATAAEELGKELRTVEMYDTTLRDGTQMEGISASVNDKLKIARQLADFGELFSDEVEQVCFVGG